MDSLLRMGWQHGYEAVVRWVAVPLGFADVVPAEVSVYRLPSPTWWACRLAGAALPPPAAR